MKKVKRALISVTDKSGVAEFAKGLAAMNVEIISTGKTAEILKDAGVNVIPISAYTGMPEMLDGRLKTLHPKIHGGILGKRDDHRHLKEMQESGIAPIDMVVVNLYAFEDTVKKGASFEEAVENIDIGGPAMIRASAKNFNDVAVVVAPEDYPRVAREMAEKKGMLSRDTRFALAKKAFQLTARYDGAISNYLSSVPDIPSVEPAKKFPDAITVQFEKVQDLRYGENPHQKAAFYKCAAIDSTGLANARQVHGKELSYNNILDLNAALQIVSEFHDGAAVIIKHNNPCGVASSKGSLASAYLNAYACDKTSAFGGVVGFNRVVTMDVAEALSRIFLEAVIAPGFDKDALELLSAKKNLRVIETGKNDAFDSGVGSCCFDVKKVSGGFLLQTPDRGSAADLKTVTKRGPNDAELEDLLFAWNVARHVKSNAIVLARGQMTIGIGAGQMSRIDSTRIAVMKAADAGLDVKGAVMASDAFFPFKDNIEMAGKHGITAVIQPGGSIKDEEVARSADQYGMAMVFTGIRHFRH